MKRSSPFIFMFFSVPIIAGLTQTKQENTKNNFDETAIVWLSRTNKPLRLLLLKLLAPYVLDALFQEELNTKNLWHEVGEHEISFPSQSKPYWKIHSNLYNAYLKKKLDEVPYLCLDSLHSPLLSIPLNAELNSIKAVYYARGSLILVSSVSLLVNANDQSMMQLRMYPLNIPLIDCYTDLPFIALDTEEAPIHCDDLCSLALHPQFTHVGLSFKNKKGAKTRLVYKIPQELRPKCTISDLNRWLGIPPSSASNSQTPPLPY